MDPIALAFAVALVIEALWCVRAAHRLSVLYRTRLFESEFFRRLVARNKRVAYIGGGILTAIVVWSLLSWALPDYVPQIPRPWGAVGFGIALMVLLSGPILDERYVSRVRRGDGDPNVRAEL